MQGVSGGERSAFEGVLNLLANNFDCVDVSPRHARVNVKIAGGSHPATIYYGSSSLEGSREVVHIASPLLNVSETRVYEIARQLDDMPLGSLRRLGGILHIHEALALGEFTDEALISCVRLIAAQAQSLMSSMGAGASAGETTQGEQ